MSFRFLYLDSDGREINLETQADLQQAVESGDLAEDMLLYDALTSEWSPARTHPLVRLALDSAEDSGTIPTEASVPDDASLPPAGSEKPDEPEETDESTEAAGEKPDTLGPGDFSGLTLTSERKAAMKGDREDPDAPAEETVRAFRERLERERLRQMELGPGAVDGGLSMVRGDRIADLHDPVAPDDEQPRPGGSSARGKPASRRDTGREASRAAPVTGRESPDDSAAPGGSWSRPSPPRPAASRPSDRPTPPSSTLPWGISPQAAILALLIGVAGWGIADALGSSSGTAEAPVEVDAGVDPGAAVPESPDEAEFDLRASTYAAFSEMQEGMDALGARLGVAQPPAAWLSGRYLADAETLPDVRDFWIRYGEFVDSIRATEEVLFRSGFVSRLRSQGVTGSAVPIRLTGALQDFREDSTRRDEIYRSMDALAAEALTLDQWLRSASERIAFAGVRGGAVSLAPEIEAAPLDDETRRELGLRLDRVLDALERVTGPDPGRVRNLTGQVLRGVPDSTGGPRP